MRAAVLVLLCQAVGCAGSQGLAPPPPYDPANAPEALTRCPAETHAAKSAREAAVGTDSLVVAETAAQAVYALAECERKQFDALDLDTPDDAAATSAVKTQFATTKTLYEEVVSSQSPPWVIGGLCRTGDLFAAYAAKMRRMRAPPQVNDPGERASWKADVEELAKFVDTEAAQAYTKALEASDAWPNVAAGNTQVKAWLSTACTGLGAAAQRYAACRLR